MAQSRFIAVWRALSTVAKARDIHEASRFFRAWARFPVVDSAERLLGSLQAITLQTVLPAGIPEVSLESVLADSGDWSLNFAERILVSAITRGLPARDIFEVGTFNGGTTRMLAELLPHDGRVVTVDLPIDQFDATQRPSAFTGADVGRAFRGSAVERKITQLRVDSLTFDASRYESAFDMVLVDGAHDYEHGFADTLTALRVVRPGGVILWDDFEGYWAGLINGIADAMGTRPLGRLQGSSLGIYLAPAGGQLRA